MPRTHTLATGMLAILPFLPLGAAQPTLSPDGPGIQARRPARVLETRLESLDWYGRSEALNIRFSLTNTTDQSLWLLRWQLPSPDMDANLLKVTRDGNPVAYLGPLVKRATPDDTDYVEVKPGETYAVLLDPSAFYDMTQQGSYAISFAPLSLQVRTRAPEVLRPRGAEPMLAFRESAPDIVKVDTLPTEKAQVAGTPATRFWFEGLGNPNELMAKPGGSTDPAFSKCTTTQIATATTAKGNALSISRKALAALNTANPYNFVWWFGPATSSSVSNIKGHFTKVEDAFANKSVVIDCGCKQNYYAYVYPTQPYKIYVCKAFWSAPALGRDSKAGTLVHEMTHFNVVVGTDDYVYGATGAHNLALTDPAKAMDNADNHEYFAEDQP